MLVYLIIIGVSCACGTNAFESGSGAAGIEELSKVAECPESSIQCSVKESENKCEVTVVLTICDSGNEPIQDRFDARRSRVRVEPTVVPLFGLAFQWLISKAFRESRKDASRQQEHILTLLKSMLITTKFSDRSCVEVIVMSDRKNHFNLIEERIFEKEKWHPSFTQFLKLKFVEASFPTGTEWMRNLYAPGATLRLFLPDILSNRDAVIYLDTDVVLLESIHELWKKFNSFSKTAVVGLAQDRTGPNVNAGVILMNLTRMRDAKWSQRIVKVAGNNPKKLDLPVQTILNSYFRTHRKELYYISRHWNFQNNVCRVKGYIKDKRLNENGISLLHGAALAFTPFNASPLIYTVYRSFEQSELNANFSIATLVQKIGSEVKALVLKKPGTLCSEFSDLVQTKLSEALKKDLRI